VDDNKIKENYNTTLLKDAGIEVGESLQSIAPQRKPFLTPLLVIGIGLFGALLLLGLFVFLSSDNENQAQQKSRSQEVVSLLEKQDFTTLERDYVDKASPFYGAKDDPSLFNEIVGTEISWSSCQGGTLAEEIKVKEQNLEEDGDTLMNVGYVDMNCSDISGRELAVTFDMRQVSDEDAIRAWKLYYINVTLKERNDTKR
jgi:hypothetical protein